MSSLTVAVDVTPLAGPSTGIAQSVRALVQALEPLDAIARLRPYAISTRALRHREGLPRGTRVVPGAGALIRSWAHRDLPTIEHAFGGADVVHATNYLVPPTRRPTLVTINDCSMVRHRALCSPDVLALEPVLRRALRREHVHVHVPSEFVAREVHDVFGLGRASGRVHVVPWAIPSICAPGDPPSEFASDTPFVLAIGTVEPRKNIPHLVAAFGRVAPNVASALVVAGPPGADSLEVDRAIARLDAAHRARIHVLGAVSDARRSWLLHHARVLAYPSVYEGFGFPVLEAMQCAVPVVAAAAGSIPEVAGDAALLVDPTDERALAHAIERLLTDEPTRDAQIERGREQVQQFSWSRTARELLAVYERLDATSTA